MHHHLIHHMPPTPPERATTHGHHSTVLTHMCIAPVLPPQLSHYYSRTASAPHTTHTPSRQNRVGSPPISSTRRAVLGVDDIPSIVFQYTIGIESHDVLLVVCGHHLGDGLQLNVRGSLIDGANLAVTVELLHRHVLGEPHTTHPLHTLGSDALCHL